MMSLARLGTRAPGGCRSGSPLRPTGRAFDRRFAPRFRPRTPLRFALRRTRSLPPPWAAELSDDVRAGRRRALQLARESLGTLLARRRSPPPASAFARRALRAGGAGPKQSGQPTPQRRVRLQRAGAPRSASV